jgi:hypothetical protein
VTPRPHDALFKAAFEAPAHAGALVRALVPPAVAEAIAWSSLAPDPGSFVDPALDDRHSDLLFTARLHTGASALIYLLLEHQSTRDPAMPLRMLSYQLRIWDRHRQRQPGTSLPPIIAVVISHAPGGWGGARSFEALFDPGVLAIPGMSRLVPHCAMLVEDLADLTDDELAARALAAFPRVALWLLRDARDPVRLLTNLTAWSAAIAEAARAPTGLHALTALLTYLYRVIQPVHHDELRDKLLLLEPLMHDVEYSIADMLEDRGLARGLQQGRIAMLRRQLAVKFHATTLEPAHEARLTAAAPEEIDQLAERLLSADSLAAVFAD